MKLNDYGIIHNEYELLEVTVQFYMEKIIGHVHSKRQEKYTMK